MYDSKVVIDRVEGRNSINWEKARSDSIGGTSCQLGDEATSTLLTYTSADGQTDVYSLHRIGSRLELIHMDATLRTFE